MGKNRVNSDSTRRRNRVESSTPPPKRVNSPGHYKNHRVTVIFAAVFIVSSLISILFYRFINKHSNISSPYNYQNNLVKTDLNYQEIIHENSRVLQNVTQRHFSNSVLAYITPWLVPMQAALLKKYVELYQRPLHHFGVSNFRQRNSAGYDLAKRFNSKFTHLSPVWYDLKSQGTKLSLEGRHNADTGWLSELRLRGNAQVLPRVVIEALPTDLFRKKKQRDEAIDLIVTECKDMDYDGVVLESWSRWAAYGVLHDAAMRKMALQFIKQLGDALHKVTSQRSAKQLQLVFVIGPPQSETLQPHDFGPDDFLGLRDSVDGFSLMTYDYSSSYSPGPNAPLLWVHSTIEKLLRTAGKSLANKVLVGINFYGNDFDLTKGGGAQAITGRDYLSLLDRYKPKIDWQEDFAEHFFLYTDDQHRPHAVFYPTPMSISKRLDEARSWGAGISIWEIGQGLDFFFDLL